MPLTTVIAVLTGTTSLLVFLTGKSNLPDILQGGQATDTPTVPPTATLTVALAPTVTARPAESTPAASTAAPTHAPNFPTAAAPSDSDLETVPSIWNLTKFRELPEPGSIRYTIEVARNSVWLWDCRFCATSDAFQDFLATLTVEFRIDDVRLGDESLRIYDRSGAGGWICRNWSTKLSGWPLDRSLFLEIRYTHSAPTSDGKDEFAAGEYRQTIVALVTT
ncbi:MAG: hypothetical protein JW929_02225 [Anaerolineales bacterium]|nr:hypothetical protein [Anaerolineales bacterium]